MLDLMNLYVEEMVLVAGLIAIVIWLASNIYMITLGYHEVKENLWESQIFIGKILAGIFYMPAWIISSIIFDIKWQQLRKKNLQEMKKLFGDDIF